MRWYFDKNQGGCVPFVYTGCGGSSNNFVNKENCESMCKRRGKSMIQSMAHGGNSRQKKALALLNSFS